MTRNHVDFQGYSTIVQMLEPFFGDDMNLRIRDVREDHDLSQTQIARHLLCDQSLYSKYERGEREIPLKLMIQLAELYHVSIDYLVHLTNNPAPYE